MTTKIPLMNNSNDNNNSEENFMVRLLNDSNVKYYDVCCHVNYAFIYF